MTERQSVYDVIAQRIHHGTKPHHHDDGNKVGLVIQSGAMLGVRTAGMVTALDAFNAADAFDAMYGSSSAGGSVAFLAARQTPQGAATFYQEMATPDYIDLGRLLQGKPAINLPYLVYDVLGERGVLNWEKVAAAENDLHIYVVDAASATTRVVTDFNSKDTTFDTLHWSARAPFIAGMPEKKDGKYHTDGALLIGSVPVQQAIDDGCSHILTLLTTRQGEAVPPRSIYDKLAGYVLWLRHPKLAKHYGDGYKNYVANLGLIQEAKKPNSHLPQIEAIQVPADGAQFHLLSTDQTLLYQGARDGFTVIYEAFRGYDLRIDQSKFLRR